MKLETLNTTNENGQMELQLTNVGWAQGTTNEMGAIWKGELMGNVYATPLGHWMRPVFVPTGCVPNSTQWGCH